MKTFKWIVVKADQKDEQTLHSLESIKAKDGTIYSKGQTHYLEDAKDLKRLLPGLLTEARENGQMLAFQSFRSFKKIPEMLGTLHKSKALFYFWDFEHLDRNALPGIELLLVQSSQSRSKKIKATLHQKKEAGEKLGNLQLGGENDPAARGRTAHAFMNQYNVAAMKEISRIRKQNAEISYNQLARELNEKGMKPRRGEKFHARTVIRLEEKSEGIKARYKKNLQRENVALGDLADEQNSAFPELNLTHEANFDTDIFFSFSPPLGKMFEVELYENQSDKPILKKVYGSETEQVSINIDSHKLLPGRYYLSIRIEGLPEIVRGIFVHKHILKAISVD